MNQKYLSEIFDYNQYTGDLIWKERPINHFPTKGEHNRWNTRFSKKKVLGKHNDGYFMVVFNYKEYSAHRVIAIIMGKCIEGKEIDHINHIRDDNRWINLNVVTQHENSKNRSLSARNTSGFTGVHYNKVKKRWVASIRVNGKNKKLGRFIKKEDAIKSRKEANIKYGFHENHGT